MNKRAETHPMVAEPKPAAPKSKADAQKHFCDKIRSYVDRAQATSSVDERSILLLGIAFCAEAIKGNRRAVAKIQDIDAALKKFTT